MKLPELIRRLFGGSLMREGLPMVDGEGNSGGNVRLPVKFFEQVHGNMCADACAMMMMVYAGAKTEAEANDILARNPRGAFEGATGSALEATYRPRGLFQWRFFDCGKGTMTADVARDCLRTFGPLGCTLSSSALFGHCVLLIGVQGEDLLFHDPWKGPDRVMQISTFNQLLCTDEPARLLYLKLQRS